jgi:hypothetical protein
MDTNPQYNAHPTGTVTARAILRVFLLVALISLVVYWFTAFRTITWWDNGSYSLAAITLGITHPPGSLLTTLLGWIVTKLAFGVSKIFALNFFAGVIAATTAGLVCSLAIGLTHRQTASVDRRSSFVVLIAAAIAGLTLSFGETPWTYATQFTPYVLTPLFTVLILWALLRWWERPENHDAVKWLFVVAVLFGLDFSVHRTNLLLLPGMLVWVLLRHPQTCLSTRSWRYGITGFAIGLSIHLLIIPLAARNPAMSMCDPSSWPKFWDYVTLKQYGGGWLINLWPRKASFFSVQMADYLRMFRDNFCSLGGKTGLLGALPMILGLVGLWSLWRRSHRLALGMIVLFVLASLGGEIYFNTPADFIRSMDRHYLPSLVIFGVWMVLGAQMVMISALKSREQYRVWAVSLVGLLILAAPAQQLMRNYSALDSSRNYCTYDFSRNALSTLPPDAIVFTNGDNDTYPLWYIQQAESFRTDVTIVNINLMNTPWYVAQLIERDPSFPLRLTRAELEQMMPKMWKDTTIAVAVQGTPADFDLPDSTILPDSLHLQVGPDVANKYLLIHSQLVLQMLAENLWKRPVCLLITMSDQALPWLKPYLRLDGLAQRLMPVDSPPSNPELLRKSFLERYSYRGYADPSLPLDETSRMFGMNYMAGFLTLASLESANGNTAECERVKERMLELLPPERLNPPAQLLQAIDATCQSDSLSSR